MVGSTAESRPKTGPRKNAQEAKGRRRAKEEAKVRRPQPDKGLHMFHELLPVLPRLWLNVKMLKLLNNRMGSAGAMVLASYDAGGRRTSSTSSW